MSIILFVLVLLILVLVHELGHFFVAKKFGIRVDEFGFGFPPRAKTLFKRGETIYSLNWIPFGGFVRIFGQDPDEETTNGPDSARAMHNKPKYVQALVLVAGVVCNLLLAWVLFTVGFASGMPTSSSSLPSGAVLENSSLMITGVMDGSPAADAGLVVGDTILGLSAGEESVTENITPTVLQDFVRAHEDEEINITHSNGEVEEVSIIVPKENNAGTGKVIGISMDTVGIVKLPIFASIIEGAKYTWTVTIGTFVGFYTLIHDAIVGTGNLDAVTGPIGIVKIVGDAYHIGFIYLLSFTAIISVNLAVINLIPFPALDGGRLLFLLIEKIKGSRINQNFANWANMIGFVILIGLMLIVSYHDIVRLF